MTEDILFWRSKVASAWLNKTNPQQPYMQPWRFKSFAEKRGFSLWPSHLESWDRIGIFHPLLRVTFPYTLHRMTDPDHWGGYEEEAINGECPPDIEVVKLIHDWSPQNIENGVSVYPAKIDTPTVENFVNWNSYEDRESQWGLVSHGSVIYHPYQIFRLKGAMDACESRTRFIDFSVPEDENRFIKEEIARKKESLGRAEIYHLKCILLLIIIEDRYLPVLRGEAYSLHLTSFGTKQNPEDWFEFREKFDTVEVLNALPFSLEEIKKMRDDLAWRGWCLDPNRSFFDLINHIPYSRRQSLRDGALLAWDYYEATNIINEFLKDATGQPQPHIDDLHQNSSWKKVIYGIEPEEVDYRATNILDRVLSRHGINPSIKVLLLVEGESEIQYIQDFCKFHSIELEHVGIRLFNLHTVGALRSKQIQEMVRYAQQDGVVVIVVVDNENKSQESLEKWREEGLVKRIFHDSDFENVDLLGGAMINSPCFEDANFSLEELLSIWRDLITADSKSINIDSPRLKQLVEETRAASTQDRPCETWIKAIELSHNHLRLQFSKPRFSQMLLKRFASTDRPIHRLINYARSCAVRASDSKTLSRKVRMKGSATGAGGHK